jgi:predicted dehydrogenase/threonine dehydrogenase-like Zn-dependent dehydrogenase
MKQLLQDLKTHKVHVEDVPAPGCHPRGVLVRTCASMVSSGTERASISLTQKSLLGKAMERPDLVRQVLRKARTAGVTETLSAVKARLDGFIAPGYSSAGIVVEVGAEAIEFSPGDRVACAGSSHASHAEVNGVPTNLCVKIPGEVEFEAASSVAIGSIALQGVRIADARIGDRVVVIGLGLVGLITAQILKSAGCVVTGIDPDPMRVRLAETLGLDFACVNSDWPQNAGQAGGLEGHGADAVIITASTRSGDPIRLAGQVARDRGIVVVVGDVRVDVPREQFYKKELEIRYSRSYGPGRYDPAYEEKGIDYPYGYVRWTEKRNMEAYLGLIASGKVRIGPLITHRFPIDQGVEAYQLLAGTHDEPYVGIVLTYPEGADFSRQMVVRPDRKPSTRPGTAKEEIGIGWIGAGSFSCTKLLPVLKRVPGIDLRCVANATGPSSRKVATRFSFRSCTTDPRAILEDDSVGVVFIATPHHLHASLVIEALKRHKHVYVEKPLCVNRDELRDIEAAYVQSKGILYVGFNRRFSPFARHCLRFFPQARGPLSILYRVNAGTIPANHWIRDPHKGHGRVIGEVCHFIDFVQAVTSAQPHKVQAWAIGPQSAGENLHIQVLLSDGSVAEISYLSNGDRGLPKEHIEIFGALKAAVCEDFRVMRFYAAGSGRTRRLWRQDKGHKAEISAFLKSLQYGGRPPIEFESLRTTTLASFAIEESLLKGEPVSIFA